MLKLYQGQSLYLKGVECKVNYQGRQPRQCVLRVLEAIWDLCDDNPTVIAAHLELAVSTVTSYLHEANLYLDCTSKASAMIKAAKRGFINARRVPGAHVPLGIITPVRVSPSTRRLVDAMILIESDDPHELARMLAIKVSTVRTYFSRALFEVGVHSKCCLAVHAMRTEIISLPVAVQPASLDQ